MVQTPAKTYKAGNLICNDVFRPHFREQSYLTPNRALVPLKEYNK